MSQPVEVLYFYRTRWGAHDEFVALFRKNHWPILRNLLRTTGTAGNLVSDAHLAAIAIEQGATVYSTDYDFKRFPGIDHVDPLSSA